MWIPAATGMGNLTTALWNKGRGSIEIVVHVQYVQIGRSANGANAMIKYAPTSDMGEMCKSSFITFVIVIGENHIAMLRIQIERNL